LGATSPSSSGEPPCRCAGTDRSAALGRTMAAPAAAQAINTAANTGRLTAVESFAAAPTRHVMVAASHDDTSTHYQTADGRVHLLPDSRRQGPPPPPGMRASSTNRSATAPVQPSSPRGQQGPAPLTTTTAPLTLRPPRFPLAGRPSWAIHTVAGCVCGPPDGGTINCNAVNRRIWWL
jgi:hypothetical protein